MSRRVTGRRHVEPTSREGPTAKHFIVEKEEVKRDRAIYFINLTLRLTEGAAWSLQWPPVASRSAHGRVPPPSDRLVIWQFVAWSAVQKKTKKKKIEAQSGERNKKKSSETDQPPTHENSRGHRIPIFPFLSLSVPTVSFHFTRLKFFPGNWLLCR